ncbi:hypothetical protein GGR57DRAFT_500476 [Xylariaceae sp. FL1272]|nr:hypothetical protein GGR57DRAFT_500476 [Xylariaceae sp. FL1272]
MASFRELAKNVMALLPAQDKEFVFPEEKFRFYPITDKGHLTAVVLSPLGRVKTWHDENSEIFNVPGRLNIVQCKDICCRQGTTKTQAIAHVEEQILTTIDHRARHIWSTLYPDFKAALPTQIHQCGIVLRHQTRERAVLNSIAKQVTPNHIRLVLQHPQCLVIVVKLVLDGEHSDPLNPPRPPRSSPIFQRRHPLRHRNSHDR